MADTNKLKVNLREKFGKGASRQLRRNGQVPAVLYGKDKDPQHVSLPTREFAAILRANGTNAVIELDVEGESQLVLTKQVDVHPIRSYIEHADLIAIKRGEKVTVEVPVLTVGEIAAGGMLIQDATIIEIEADVLNIPENIEVNIEGIEAGNQISAGDIKLPADVTLVSDPEMLIFNIIEPQEAETELNLDTEEPEAETASTEAPEAEKSE